MSIEAQIAKAVKLFEENLREQLRRGYRFKMEINGVRSQIETFLVSNEVKESDQVKVVSYQQCWRT